MTHALIGTVMPCYLRRNDLTVSLVLLQHGDFVWRAAGAKVLVHSRAQGMHTFRHVSILLQNTTVLSVGTLRSTRCRASSLRAAPASSLMTVPPEQSISVLHQDLPSR